MSRWVGNYVEASQRLATTTRQMKRAYCLCYAFHLTPMLDLGRAAQDVGFGCALTACQKREGSERPVFLSDNMRARALLKYP